MFTGKTSLRTSDLSNGKAFLKCMSYDDAMKVNSSEIFKVFEMIGNEDLSWPAVSERNEHLKSPRANNASVLKHL